MGFNSPLLVPVATTVKKSAVANLISSPEVLEFLLPSFKKCSQGSSAVAELVFCVEIDLSHGAVELRQQEEWVVAEAAASAWRGQDAAFDFAFDSVRGFAVFRDGEDGAVASCAQIVGDVSQLGEEAGVVALIC